jgi:hypothetical protein
VILSVIIDYLHVVWPGLGPNKADSVLLIYSDALLT